LSVGLGGDELVWVGVLYWDAGSRGCLASRDIAIPIPPVNQHPSLLLQTNHKIPLRTPLANPQNPVTEQPLHQISELLGQDPRRLGFHRIDLRRHNPAQTDRLGARLVHVPILQRRLGQALLHPETVRRPEESGRAGSVYPQDRGHGQDPVEDGEL
jgi:hypothetical protein